MELTALIHPHPPTPCNVTLPAVGRGFEHFFYFPFKVIGWLCKLQRSGHILCNISGGSTGRSLGTRNRPGPIYFIFMQFFVKKILPNNKFAHVPLGLAPPPLGNRGSATEY